MAQMTDFHKWGCHTTQTRWAQEADELESQAVRYGECSYDASLKDENASGELVEEQVSGTGPANANAGGGTIEENIQRNGLKRVNEIELKDRRREKFAAGARKEIERRVDLLGASYPFKAEETHLKLKRGKGNDSLYLELLRLSTANDLLLKDRERFEIMVGRALQSYLGPSAKHRCCGWRTKEEPDVNRFKERLGKVYSASNELKWSPGDGFPDDPPSNLIKDLGLDVVAWLPMPDKRAGQVFLVAQCATGRTDWEGKFDDLNWSNLGCWARPLPEKWGGVRCFAVPFHIPNFKRWEVISGRAGMLFDRARLTLLLKE